MANTIKYNLEEMRNSVNIIKQNTTHIESVIKSIDRIINDICSEWEGYSYSSFMDNYRRIRPSKTSVVNVLEDLHKNLAMAADKMEEEDASLWNKIGAAVGNGVQAVEGLGKQVEKEFSPGNFGYKVLKVGKAVSGVAIGGIVIVASGIIEVGSVGALTFPMVATASFGANSITNGFRDLWYCSTGQFEKAVDYVKTTCFKYSKIDNWGNAAEVPIKMLVEANPGKIAKVISSGKLVSNVKKIWDRVNKVYDEALQ